MKPTAQQRTQRPAANVPLFRQEALDHFKNRRQYGELLTISEPSFKYVAVVGVVIVALGVAGLFVLPYSRKVQVNGVITPLAGVKMIATPLSGIVTKSWVREGQKVKANEVLFVVDASISSTNRDIGESVARSIADTRRNLLGARKQSIVIKAPQDGTVTSITAESGQPVSPGRNLARLIPDNSPLIVELYVSSRSAGFLNKGMAVKLAYQPYPFERYGLHDGKVIEIATSALANEEMTLPGAQLAAQGEAGFRVRVMPEKQTIRVDGIETALVPGMSVDARLVQEQRPLVAWLFAPLLTIIRGL